MIIYDTTGSNFTENMKKNEYSSTEKSGQMGAYIWTLNSITATRQPRYAHYKTFDMNSRWRKKTTTFPWTCFIFGIPEIGRGPEQCVKRWVVWFRPEAHQCSSVALVPIILESYLNKTFMKLSEKCVTNAMLDICRCGCVCVYGSHSVVQTTNILHHPHKTSKHESWNQSNDQHERKKKKLRNLIETFGTTNNKSGKIFSPWNVINNGHSFWLVIVSEKSSAVGNTKYNNWNINNLWFESLFYFILYFFFFGLFGFRWMNSNGY